MVAADVTPAGRLIYDAFKDVAGRHAFPPAFPSLETASRVVGFFLGLASMHCLVAEHDGQVVGAIFLDEGDEIRAVGLIGVDPMVQRRGIGRQLMEAGLARARGAAGVRLVQEAFNTHAMGLYAALGFEVKEPLARVVGRPTAPVPSGVEIRPLRASDLEACAGLCRRVHGITRTVDLQDALTHFRTFAVLRGGRLVAYTYEVFRGILAWGVAESEADLHALLAGAARTLDLPLAFLLPTRQTSFFRWCLAEGFRIEKPLTLMAMGQYQEPRGPWFPSGFY